VEKKIFPNGHLPPERGGKVQFAVWPRNVQVGSSGETSFARGDFQTHLEPQLRVMAAWIQPNSKRGWPNLVARSRCMGMGHLNGPTVSNGLTKTAFQRGLGGPMGELGGATGLGRAATPPDEQKPTVESRGRHQETHSTNDQGNGPPDIGGAAEGPLNKKKIL